MMFEKYNMNRFYLGTQAVLALYSSGRLTGLAVDIGAGVTHTVPIFEGYTMNHAVRRSNIAGRDLTTYMSRCLAGCGVYLTTSAEAEIARRIKEAPAFSLSWGAFFSVAFAVVLRAEPVLCGAGILLRGDGLRGGG